MLLISTDVQTPAEVRLHRKHVSGGERGTSVLLFTLDVGRGTCRPSNDVSKASWSTDDASCREPQVGPPGSVCPESAACYQRSNGSSLKTAANHSSTTTTFLGLFTACPQIVHYRSSSL